MRVRRSAPRNNVVIGRENIIPWWFCSLQRAARRRTKKKQKNIFKKE